MENTTAKTKYGIVKGEKSGGIIRFLGIPYADSIGGQGRFSPPNPPALWSGTLKTNKVPPVVPQVPDGMEMADPEWYHFHFGLSPENPMDESGLYLNIWTPSLYNKARKPVMLWLHGGEVKCLN